MQVRQYTKAGLVVLEPVGEVDIYTVGDLRTALAECLETDRTQIVVNLAGVTFIDSSGLGVLVGGLKRVNAAGGSLRLIAPSNMLLRMLKTTGLTKVFAVYDSLGTLLAAQTSESLD